MKTILLIALLLTGCGGYSVKEDGIIGAPIEAVGLYWMFGIDKEERTRLHANAIDNCARYGYGCNRSQVVVVNPNQQYFPK